MSDMQPKAAPELGPAVAATIITRDLDDSIAAYTQHLGQRLAGSEPFDAAQARACGWEALAGTRSAWLANALGEPWLRLVEHRDATVMAPFTHYGWLALEVAVADVDALGKTLPDSPFAIIGPPADLAMSDAIRAMQVIGPDGEVLYLTQIKRPVAGFELPTARCAVDRLFIPVMTCPDREAALAHYTALSGNDGLRFDTRITVINRALGFDIGQEHPVATLQLRGATLIEIDQVDQLAPAPFGGPALPGGIALIHFAHPTGHPGVYTGAAGERYLLVTPPQGSTR